MKLFCAPKLEGTPLHRRPWVIAPILGVLVLMVIVLFRMDHVGLGQAQLLVLSARWRDSKSPRTAWKMSVACLAFLVCMESWMLVATKRDTVSILIQVGFLVCMALQLYAVKLEMRDEDEIGTTT